MLAIRALAVTIVLPLNGRDNVYSRPAPSVLRSVEQIINVKKQPRTVATIMEVALIVGNCTVTTASVITSKSGVA